MPSVKPNRMPACFNAIGSGSSRAAAAVLLCALLAACGGQAGDGAGAAGSDNSEPAIATPAPGTETREGALDNATRVLGAAQADCPLTGEWRLCSIEDRLVRAGLAPQRADSAPALKASSVVTARYFLGDAEAQVFIFNSSEARSLAEESEGLGLGEAPMLEAAVGSPAILISSQNMAAVIHGFRPRQVERVSLALSGGLPQG